MPSSQTDIDWVMSNSNFEKLWYDVSKLNIMNSNNPLYASNYTSLLSFENLPLPITDNVMRI